MELEFREGNSNDKEWIYSLYVLTMKTHIDKTWGWNEEFQSNLFNSDLHPTKFEIVSIEGVNVGVFLVIEKVDHLWLEMLLICPDKQNKGIGKLLINKLIESSKILKLSLRLSVIKANPVLSFYEKLGFSIYDEDEEFYKLEWEPNG